MSIAPNLPTNIIKDTDIQFNKMFIKTTSSPSMCVDINNNIMYNTNCSIYRINQSGLFDNTNQQYIYNPVKKQLMNNNACLDIDNLQNSKLIWSPCDPSNPNQQYIYASNTFKNVNNLCTDLQNNKLVDCNNVPNKFVLLSNIIDNITNNQNNIGIILNNVNKLIVIYTNNYNTASNNFFIFQNKLNPFWEKYNSAMQLSLPIPDIYNDPEFISIQKSKADAYNQMSLYSNILRDLDSAKQNITYYSDYHSGVLSNANNLYNPVRTAGQTFDQIYNSLLSLLNNSNDYYNNVNNNYNNITNKYNIKI